MNQLHKLSQAVLALRQRCSNARFSDAAKGGQFGHAVKDGKIQLQLVQVLPSGSVVLPVSPWLDPASAVTFTRCYEVNDDNFKKLVLPLQEIQKRNPFGSKEHIDAYNRIRLAVRVFKGNDIGEYE